MHTPLDPHLHTAECNVIIRQLMDCHEQKSLVRQLFGACNDLDWAMRKCTKAERLAKVKAATEVSKKRSSEVSARMARRDREGRTLKEDMTDLIKRQEEALKEGQKRREETKQ